MMRGKLWKGGAPMICRRVAQRPRFNPNHLCVGGLQKRHQDDAHVKSKAGGSASCHFNCQFKLTLDACGNAGILKHTHHYFKTYSKMHTRLDGGRRARLSWKMP